VLQVVPIEQKQVLINYKIQFPYTILNEVMMIMKRNDCVIMKNSQELFCNLEAGIPKNKVEFVLGRLKELKEIEVEAF